MEQSYLVHYVNRTCHDHIYMHCTGAYFHCCWMLLVFIQCLSL